MSLGARPQVSGTERIGNGPTEPPLAGGRALAGCGPRTASRRPAPVNPTPAQLPSRALSAETGELPGRKQSGSTAHGASRSVCGFRLCRRSARGPASYSRRAPRLWPSARCTQRRRRHFATRRYVTRPTAGIGMAKGPGLRPGSGSRLRTRRRPVVRRSSGDRLAEGAVGREGLFVLRPGVPVVAPVGAAIGTRWIGRGRRVQCGLDPLVMLGVLQEVFRGNAIPGRERVASQPVVTIRNLAGRSPYLDARAAIAFERLVWTAAASSLRPTAMAAGTSGRFRSVVHVGSCYSCWVSRMKSACVVRARGTCIWQNTSRSEVRGAVQQQFGQHRYEDQLGVLYMKMRSVDGLTGGGLSPPNPETARSGRGDGLPGRGCN